jgi:hypothetical protein
MTERYAILHNNKVLYKNLTEEEYFDMMEDLSIEYYQTGFPRPQELETKITRIRRSLRLLVIKRRRSIAVKVKVNIRRGCSPSFFMKINRSKG